MKKNISRIFILTMILFVFSVTSAMAGWGSWQNQAVPKDGEITVYFLVLKEGDHKIGFHNDAGTYHGGVMESCWASTNNYVWDCWALSDVFSYERRQDLYAGSDDIIFKFIFTNTSDETRTFYWRFYTD